MPTPVRVLAVCTGNVCRSPAVELLLHTALAGDPLHPQVIVSSRGTQALVGHEVSAPMADLLRSVGASTNGFTAGQLTALDVTNADLVLTATRAHRAAVVGLAPAAVRRTFTVREFAHLTSHVPRGLLTGDHVADRLRELVRQAPAQRAQAGATTSDIEDPWRQSAAVYRRSFDLIFASVLTILDAVAR